MISKVFDIKSKIQQFLNKLVGGKSGKKELSDTIKNRQTAEIEISPVNHTINLNPQFIKGIIQ